MQLSPLQMGITSNIFDADDVLHAQKIEKQVERLRDAGPLAMASGAWSRFRSDVSEAVFTPEDVWRDMNAVDWLIASWLGGGMMPTFLFPYAT